MTAEGRVAVPPSAAPVAATAGAALPASVDGVVSLLAGAGYICDRRLATALFLSLKLQRPLFLSRKSFSAASRAWKNLAPGAAGLSILAQTIFSTTANLHLYFPLNRRGRQCSDPCQSDSSLSVSCCGLPPDGARSLLPMTCQRDLC